MLMRLIMLGVQGVLSIFTAEAKHGAGAGPLKKKEVLRTIETQAAHVGLHELGRGCDFAELMVIVDELIDSLVALFNCVGLLEKKG